MCMSFTIGIVLQVVHSLPVICQYNVEKSSGYDMVICLVSLSLLVTLLDLYMNSMESQLGDFERRHNIKSRWKVTDPEYSDAKQCFLKEKQEQVVSCLWASVTRRHYLLRMKAKYAG